MKQKVELSVENIVPIITPQINTLAMDRIRHSKDKISPIGLIDYLKIREMLYFRQQLQRDVLKERIHKLFILSCLFSPSPESDRSSYERN